jgi:hypothetical protein
MQVLKDIAALITVRNFLTSSVEDMRIKLSREEVKNIQNKVAVMDRAILEQAIKIDVSEFNAPKNVMTTHYTTHYTFQAAEDVETTVRNLAGVSCIYGPGPTGAGAGQQGAPNALGPTGAGCNTSSFTFRGTGSGEVPSNYRKVSDSDEWYPPEQVKIASDGHEYVSVPTSIDAPFGVKNIEPIYKNKNKKKK